MDEFFGVGLVRSEYLFRAQGQYPTGESARHIISPYLEALGNLSRGLPIWYRTLEVTVAEANTLSGVDRVYRPTGYDFMGLRGVRRSQCHPDSLRVELDAIKEVRRTHSNIGVVAPFVSTPDELSWFAEMVDTILGANTPLATMLETPAAVLLCHELLTCAPVSNVVVGCNDLSSLLNATRRRMGESIPLSASLKRALKIIREVTRDSGVTMTVAGYLTPDVIRYCQLLNCDVVSLHYSDLPKLLGEKWRCLPDLDRVANVKNLTIQRIAELDSTDAIRRAPSPPEVPQLAASPDSD